MTHLAVLIKKNFKLLFRDRTLLILTILTPIFAVFVYSFSANYSPVMVHYNIAFINYDAQNVNDPAMNLSSIVSVQLIYAIGNLTSIENGQNVSVFNIIDKYQGNPINETTGMQMCDEVN